MIFSKFTGVDLLHHIELFTCAGPFAPTKFFVADSLTFDWHQFLTLLLSTAQNLKILDC
jgi:hypothetical protein